MSKRGSLSTRTMVDFKSTPLEPLAFKARVVQLANIANWAHALLAMLVDPRFSNGLSANLDGAQVPGAAINERRLGSTQRVRPEKTRVQANPLRPVSPDVCRGRVHDNGGHVLGRRNRDRCMTTRQYAR